MLGGYTPFDRDTEAEEIRAIVNGDFRFTPQEYWNAMSDSAKEFISKCLEIDPSKRITAHDALKHSFLQNSGYAGENNTVQVPRIHIEKAPEPRYSTDL